MNEEAKECLWLAVNDALEEDKKEEEKTQSGNIKQYGLSLMAKDGMMKRLSSALADSN